MEVTLKKLIESKIKNAAIKMGQYRFPLHSYMYEMISRGGKNGVADDDIYKYLEQHDMERNLVFLCLLYMCKIDEVEAFHTQKEYFRMKYRIKNKW